MVPTYGSRLITHSPFARWCLLSALSTRRPTLSILAWTLTNSHCRSLYVCAVEVHLCNSVKARWLFYIALRVHSGVGPLAFACMVDFTLGARVGSKYQVMPATYCAHLPASRATDLPTTAREIPAAWWRQHLSQIRRCQGPRTLARKDLVGLPWQPRPHRAASGAVHTGHATVRNTTAMWRTVTVIKFVGPVSFQRARVRFAVCLGVMFYMLGVHMLLSNAKCVCAFRIGYHTAHNGDDQTTRFSSQCRGN